MRWPARVRLPRESGCSMDDEGPGIVWLVNGRELPFDEEGEPPRTWLEESSSWGVRDADASDDESVGEDGKADSPKLVWL